MLLGYAAARLAEGETVSVCVYASIKELLPQRCEAISTHVPKDDDVRLIGIVMECSSEWVTRAVKLDELGRLEWQQDECGGDHEERRHARDRLLRRDITVAHCRDGDEAEPHALKSVAELRVVSILIDHNTITKSFAFDLYHPRRLVDSAHIPAIEAGA